MNTPTKTLCLYYGGSHLYRLNTLESDIDERGIFMHLDPAYILGTKRFDEERKQNDEQDKVLKELSHYCSLLRRSNSEALEILFAESQFEAISPEFKLIRHHRYSFVDSKGLFNCLRGYMKGELRLALGERKGKIGGKRYAKLQEVGYSPKNFTQLLRLANVGITFFREDRYVVDTRDFADGVHELLMSIKTTPEKHTVEELKQLAADAEASLVTAYENRSVNHEFNEDLMNELLLQIYLPILQEHNYR